VDFSSATEDFATAKALYGLAVDALRPVALAPAGLSADRNGLLLLLALAKGTAGLAAACPLEGGFAGWFHGGRGRFELRKLQQPDGTPTARRCPTARAARTESVHLTAPGCWQGSGGVFITGDRGGAARVISDCHFAVQLNHFIPGFLSYTVAVFRK
jgi:hypothetical protein